MRKAQYAHENPIRVSNGNSPVESKQHRSSQQTTITSTKMKCWRAAEAEVRYTQYTRKSKTEGSNSIQYFAICQNAANKSQEHTHFGNAEAYGKWGEGVAEWEDVGNLKRKADEDERLERRWMEDRARERERALEARKKIVNKALALAATKRANNKFFARHIAAIDAKVCALTAAHSLRCFCMFDIVCVRRYNSLWFEFWFFSSSTSWPYFHFHFYLISRG